MAGHSSLRNADTWSSLAHKTKSEPTARGWSQLLIALWNTLQRNKEKYPWFIFTFTVKVKLSTCLFKHRNLKTFGGSKVRIHQFLTSKRDERVWSELHPEFLRPPTLNGAKGVYTNRDADKSLARPGRKQATATEDFEFHISYL